MEEEKNFVPALGVAVLTPLYQVVVDAFCRDTHIKANDQKGPGRLGRDVSELCPPNVRCTVTV